MKGHVKAQLKVGRMYEEGRGRKKDDLEAFGWYLNAAKKGPSSPSFRTLCVRVRSCARVFHLVDLARQTGNPKGMYNVGRMYKHGNGVRRNATKAMHWLLKAGELGNADAQYQLGCIYARGDDLVHTTRHVTHDTHKSAHVTLTQERDDAQAIQWWQKAVAADHAKAQVKLGLAYAHGRGVERSLEQAFHWHTKAAEQGDAAAQFYCGLALQLGEGVAPDPARARERYEQAAAYGIVQACFNLGGMLPPPNARRVCDVCGAHQMPLQ